MNHNHSKNPEPDLYHAMSDSQSQSIRLQQQPLSVKDQSIIQELADWVAHIKFNNVYMIGPETKQWIMVCSMDLVAEVFFLRI